VVVFVATATRLAAARREQRLAALRLAGATTGQVGVMAAVEALVAAVGGVAVGMGVFLALRSRLARIPLDGASFYPSDLHLSVAGTLAIVVAVPVLAVVAALVTLRRVRVSPLGVTRRAVRARPTPRPLLLVVVGLVALVVAIVVDRRSPSGETAIAVVIGLTFLVMITGVVLSGPWLTALVARGVARVGRRAPSLLAARRLEDNPSAAFRAISGIVLAVFVGTVFSGIAASVLSRDERLDDDGVTADVVAASSREEVGREPVPGEVPLPTPIAPAEVARLVADLRAVPGVRAVVEVHGVGDDPELRDALARTPVGFDPTVTLVSCEGVAALGVAPCEGTTMLHVGASVIAASDARVPVSAAELADAPVTALAVGTDGDAATMERARTVLEAGIPGGGAVTRADMEAESQEEVRTQERVTNIALAVTLVIAGCSLAVAVSGTIVERRQAFAQLRLAGTRLADLRRVVMAEAAAPLLVVAGASVALGLAVSALVLAAAGSNEQFVLPGSGYWLSLGGGLALALLVVMATLPLLARLTDLDAARFE
jgi:predicted lysophospholipase L1 biosynthesis ABC-type transport system permease subunit